MIRKRCFLLILTFLVCCLVGCNPNHLTKQQLLIGKWTLKLKKSTFYIDDIEQSSNLLTTTATSYATLQFNKDGTFNSDNHLSFTTGSATLTAIYSVNGTYTYTGTAFSMSYPVGGTSIVLNGGGSGPPPVVNLVQHDEAITFLSATVLIIHADELYTYQTANNLQGYRYANDYLYNKP
jgi:hypothetical protein